MLKEFTETIKEDGRSFKWFYKKYIKNNGISYEYFLMQKNGQRKITGDVKNSMEKYLNEY